MLGPLLFLVYINDLAQDLECPCYMFADDVKIVGSPSEATMQNDLNKVHKWTVEWDLPLNMSKCNQLLATGVNVDPKTLGSSDQQVHIPRVTEMKDLGVRVTADFKPTAQCLAAAKKGNGALYGLRKTVASQDPTVLLPLYKAFVRPHLEYCIQAWSPFLRKDTAKLESVQRAFTRLFPNLKDLDYKTRLERLDLFSLEKRRLRRT